MSPNKLDAVVAQLGANIRRLRERAGLTQDDLAEQTGIAVRSLSRIETGAMRPSLATVVEIAGALGVPVARLFRTTVATKRRRGRPRRTARRG